MRLDDWLPVIKHRASSNKEPTSFFLVPFNFSKNGAAKKAEVVQGLINGDCDFDGVANYTPPVPLALGRGEICAATEATAEVDVADEPQLDFRLMWTWFLPNPLWKPKHRR